MATPASGATVTETRRGTRCLLSMHIGKARCGITTRRRGTHIAAAVAVAASVWCACEVAKSTGSPQNQEAAPQSGLPAGLPPHRLFATASAAVAAAIPANARVVGFGEFHQRTDRPRGRDTLAVFRTEILPAMAPRVSDLVLETWIVEKGCQQGLAASRQIEGAMKRPTQLASQVSGQIGSAQRAGIVVHAMTLRCAELTAIAGAGHDEVDVVAMLGLVTRELSRIGTSVVRVRDAGAGARPLVALYGGALHNDRFPDPSVAEWSYASELDRISDNRYVEIDLISPELASSSQGPKELWRQLLPYAREDQVILYQRGTRSFVVILPTAGGGVLADVPDVADGAAGNEDRE